MKRKNNKPTSDSAVGVGCGVSLFAPIEFETFRRISSYEVSNLTFNEPSSFNGDVKIIKYKVRVEQVEEPKEVYQERLQKLWDEEDNYHHYDPIKNMANRLDINLIGDFGNKRRKSN
jgi:hypothetical protein